MKKNRLAFNIFMDSEFTESNHERYFHILSLKSGTRETFWHYTLFCLLCIKYFLIYLQCGGYRKGLSRMLIDFN